MLDILTSSIARAGGIEVSADPQILQRPSARRSILKGVAESVRRGMRAFERWNLRRSTWLTLKALDDRTLADIGLDRGMLYQVADDIVRLPVANDNDARAGRPRLAANDNDHSVRAG